MATLADSFLDDLDELGESSDEETQEESGVKSEAREGGEGEDGMEVRVAVPGRAEKAEGGQTPTWSVAFHLRLGLVASPVVHAGCATETSLDRCRHAG